jgi:predicted outer membrane repeat protein
VTECLLDSNTAVRFAGALFLSNGGSITASNFTKSSATSGGAIYSQVSVVPH